MNKIKFFEEMIGVLMFNDPDAVKKGKIKKETIYKSSYPENLPLDLPIDDWMDTDPEDMTNEEIIKILEGLR